MCTAITFNKDGVFFGRTLDAEESFGERVILVPRYAPLSFSDGYCAESHYALLGMGIIHGAAPLFFDGMNEVGLCGAALNFDKFCKYKSADQEKNKIASFEVICRILSFCKSVGEAKNLLSSPVITDLSADKSLPPSPLHWIFADNSRAITVEQTEEGLSVYDNKIGVLTNAPDFPFHEKRVTEISSLSPKNAEGDFFSLGYGAIGLPGDYSSPSRFLRGAYMRRYAECKTHSDFFRAIDTVSIPRGAVINNDGKEHYTLYSSVYDAVKRILYRRTYPSLDILSVSLTENLLSEASVRYI